MLHKKRDGRRVGLPAELVTVTPGSFFAPDWPIPDRFTARGRWQSGPMHFFTDDYRQEFCFRHPVEGLLVSLAAGVCTAPDFTCWTDDPLPWRLYQGWRSALIAGYWQAAGVRVLPVVSFGSGVEQYVRPGSTWSVRGPARGSDEAAWFVELSAFLARAAAARLVVFGRWVPQFEALPLEVVSRRLRDTLPQDQVRAA